MKAVPLGGKTIYVPQAVDTGFKGTCHVCGSEFSSPSQWQYHVGRCARQHLDEIRAEREDFLQRTQVCDHPDPEVEAHMRKVGERMLREGRLTVKPSERAGFS